MGIIVVVSLEFCSEEDVGVGTEDSTRKRPAFIEDHCSTPQGGIAFPMNPFRGPDESEPRR